MTPEEFSRKLEIFRQCFPCSLDGGFRTAARNKIIGGAPNSWHLYALAADLIFDSIEELYKAADAAMDVFGGVELDLKNNHLHVDGRPLEKPWHVVHRKTNDYWGYHPLRVFLTQSAQKGTMHHT